MIIIPKIPTDGELIGGINTKIYQADHLINQDHQASQLLTKHLPHLIQIGKDMEDQIIT